MAILNVKIELDYIGNTATAAADAMEAVSERIRDTVEGDSLVPGEHGAVLSSTDEILVRWWVSEE